MFSKDTDNTQTSAPNIKECPVGPELEKHTGFKSMLDCFWAELPEAREQCSFLGLHWGGCWLRQMGERGRRQVLRRKICLGRRKGWPDPKEGELDTIWCPVSAPARWHGPTRNAMKLLTLPGLPSEHWESTLEGPGNQTHGSVDSGLCHL